MEVEAPSSPPRRRRIILIILLAVALIAGGGYALLNLLVEPVDKQLPPNIYPVLIQVDKPTDRASYPLNAVVPVEARVASQENILSVELWVDGTLVEHSETDTAGTTGFSNNRWQWKPEKTGEHNLVVRAYDSLGRAVTADPLRIFITAQQGGRRVVQLEDNETLAALAERLYVSPTKLEPVVAVGQDSENTSRLYFAPYQPAETAPNAAGSRIENPKPLPNISVRAILNLVPDRIAFWFKSRRNPVSLPPDAPQIVGSVVACEPTLWLMDQSSAEDGFFIYRSDPAGVHFERIAVLDSNVDSIPIKYLDLNTPDSGTYIYYVSAFNPAGEMPSNLVSLTLTEQECSTTPANSLKLIQGKAVFSTPLDRVYFYARFNGNGTWLRIPEDGRAYFPLEGNTIDLMPTFEALFNPYPPLSFGLELEAWGWRGDQLIYLGNYKGSVERTQLLFCTEVTGCSGINGISYQKTSGSIASNAPAQQRDFSWSGTVDKSDGIIWQISEQPFGSDFALQPTGMVASGYVPGENAGSFKIDFKTMTQLEPAPEETSQTTWMANLISPNPLPQDEWARKAAVYPEYKGPESAVRTYYVRVLPMSGNQPVGITSNVVTLTYAPQLLPNPQAGASTAQTTTTSGANLPEPPPAMYQVEYVDYQPGSSPQLPWGCVQVMGVDKNILLTSLENSMPWTTSDLRNTILQSYEKLAEDRQIICPNPAEEGDQVQFTSMFDPGPGAAGWSSELYAALKDATIQKMVSGINASAAVTCAERCAEGLRAGLDEGLLAIGLPPTLPGLPTLVSGQKAYIISLMIRSAQFECDKDCLTVIASTIEEFFGETNRRNTEQFCSTDQASIYQADPLCFPLGVQVEPANESGYVPASLTLKITRTAESSALREKPAYYTYKIGAYLDGYNNTLIGKTVNVPVDTGFSNDSNSPEFIGAPLKITEPLRGELFKPINVKMPILAAGESAELTFYLQPTEYWLPGHTDLIAEKGGVVTQDDWRLLYEDGALILRLTVNCQLDDGVDPLGRDVYFECGTPQELSLPSYPLPK
ncbi:MAG: hypothetical protein ABFD29_13745 [Anaerolineaceae bacterium]